MKPPGDALARAVDALCRGAVVCMPTETSYGLAVDVRVAGAVDRLLALKAQRSAPIAFIAADPVQARSLARVWPARAEALAAAHWPGPLTLVVPARADLPAAVIGPSGGVGVRVSSHEWPVALAAALGAPITATSANPSGLPPAQSADQARGYFRGRVDVYLDAGPCAGAPPSTVVDVSEDGATAVLRQGAVVV